ncbi:hypothetical protein [Sporosalibacterium faouarense]|uniref:hypothetical protein n=1 Tax=Sporosalibacterium faouarense TaxID=516123 RepID=UPI00141C5434|nr:hypothetical protein [Sporosalibacterium faouarense]MTI48858.1 hypothetical protein [Bacillota bacterium]
MKKGTIIIAFSLLGALMLMSGGYGYWKDSLTITGEVKVQSLPSESQDNPLTATPSIAIEEMQEKAGDTTDKDRQLQGQETVDIIDKEIEENGDKSIDKSIYEDEPKIVEEEKDIENETIEVNAENEDMKINSELSEEKNAEKIDESKSNEDKNSNTKVKTQEMDSPKNDGIKNLQENSINKEIKSDDTKESKGEENSNNLNVIEKTSKEYNSNNEN